MQLHQLPLEMLMKTTQYLDSSDALKLSYCSKQYLSLRRFIFGNRGKLVLGAAVKSLPRYIKDYTQCVSIEECDNENKLKLHFKLLERFANIREINIHYMGCFNIGLLSKLTRLHKLELYIFGIKDLSVISNCQYLQDLAISN
ncbi:hypothetical protein BC833DRAFT_607120, partial [Globomyces pollinis-pini]